MPENALYDYARLQRMYEEYVRYSREEILRRNEERVQQRDARVRRYYRQVGWREYQQVGIPDVAVPDEDITVVKDA